MFSAKAQEIDKDTGIRVGADDYLTKPSAPSEIVSHVEKLLALKKGKITKREKVNG
jgi:DNA-binding response OmpR family regulator